MSSEPKAEPSSEKPESSAPAVESTPGRAARGRKKRAAAETELAGMYPNNVRKLRQAAMLSKAELARRAGVSPLTIDRVEAGCPSRMDTKRKILEALGLPPSAREDVFGSDSDQA
jgi:ribosome-binding protein aMBF1 (putative translation factor)